MLQHNISTITNEGSREIGDSQTGRFQLKCIPIEQEITLMPHLFYIQFLKKTLLKSTVVSYDIWNDYYLSPIIRVFLGSTLYRLCIASMM